MEETGVKMEFRYNPKPKAMMLIIACVASTVIFYIVFAIAKGIWDISKVSGWLQLGYWIFLLGWMCASIVSIVVQKENGLKVMGTEVVCNSGGWKKVKIVIPTLKIEVCERREGIIQKVWNATDLIIYTRGEAKISCYDIEDGEGAYRIIRDLICQR